MFRIFWHFSAAVHGYAGRYLPTNIAIQWLRNRRGLKWVVPVALVVVPGYLFAMSLCAALAARGGPGWLNGAVILLFWNAMKFAWMAALSPLKVIQCRVSTARGQTPAGSQFGRTEQLARGYFMGQTAMGFESRGSRGSR